MTHAVVYPVPGKEKEMAKALLALAKDPMEVRTTYEDRLAFLVPQELYDRYVGGDVREPEPVADVLSEEQVRRRPGRPRKVKPAEESDD